MLRQQLIILNRTIKSRNAKRPPKDLSADDIGRVQGVPFRNINDPGVNVSNKQAKSPVDELKRSHTHMIELAGLPLAV